MPFSDSGRRAAGGERRGGGRRAAGWRAAGRARAVGARNHEPVRPPWRTPSAERDAGGVLGAENATGMPFGDQ
jgi:hypothetical protein